MGVVIIHTNHIYVVQFRQVLTQELQNTTGSSKPQTQLCPPSMRQNFCKNRLKIQVYNIPSLFVKCILLYATLPKKEKKKERSETVQIHIEWQKHNLFQVYVNVLIFCHNMVFKKLSYLKILKSIKEIHYLMISADRETKQEEVNTLQVSVTAMCSRRQKQTL